MAYSPSPQTVVAGSSTQLNRISASPTTQLPLSKRDKKRLNMADRLTEISNNFTANRDTFYRQQLQAYQADINYIQQANPYSNKTLEDPTDDPSEEAAGSAAASTQGSLRTTQQTHQNSIGRTELPFKTGRHTAKFVQAINDAMEKRDVDMTALVVCPISLLQSPRLRTQEQSPILHMNHADPSTHSTGTIFGSTKYKKTMNIRLLSPTKSTSGSLRLCASVLSKA